MNRTDSVLTISPLAFFFIAGAVIVLIGGALGLTVYDYSFNASQVAAEFRGRVMWATTLMVTVTLAIANLVLAVAICRNALARIYFRSVLGIILASCMAAAVAQLLPGGTPLAFVKIITVREPVARALVTFINVLTGGVIAVVVCASCVLVRPLSGLPVEKEIRERMATARLLLFAVASLLVAGVAMIYWMFEWAAAIASPPSESAITALSSLGDTMTRSAGLLYTLLLAVVYAPVAIIHEMWIRRVLEERYASIPDLKGQEWLESTGLTRSTASTFAQLFAVASPWLAALGLPQIMR
jgi:hypothetical protein